MPGNSGYGELRQQYASVLGWVYIFCGLIALLVLLNPIRLWRKARSPVHLRSVAIVVLGDIGRSPRMMYHAESFANEGFETFLIGYKGSALIPSLLSIPHVRSFYLREPPAFINRMPRLLFVVFAPVKILQQVYTVLHTLLTVLPYPPEFIVVQNPPSIPTLALVQLACWLHGSKLIIDWHNLGYTVLALRMGWLTGVILIAKWFEWIFGRSAYAHLFVTHAMKDFLVRNWHLKGIKVVLHDRPPAHFHAAETTEIHDLFNRLDLSSADLSFFPTFERPISTPFTQLTETVTSATISPNFGSTNLPQLRPDRPALLVSSTSWTPDENFAILLNGMQFYEKRARQANAAAKDGKSKVPKLLVIVTGKGPLREKFMEDIEEVQKLWHWVRCVPMWLEAEDYPILLGSADLGVSLHASSSALDLPMKIVDMFGCGLPVCALDFACLNELVREGENGLVFKTALQLAEQLENILTGFPQAQQLAKLRKGVARASSARGPQGERWNTWQENWNVVVKPIVTHRAGQSNT